MGKYEIIFDFDDGWTTEFALSEIFEGTWTELQEYLKQMKKWGCYNISASLLYEYEIVLNG